MEPNQIHPFDVGRGTVLFGVLVIPAVFVVAVLAGELVDNRLLRIALIIPCWLLIILVIPFRVAGRLVGDQIDIARRTPRSFMTLVRAPVLWIPALTVLGFAVVLAVRTPAL